ncbi:G2/mitotic-specific cyclin-B3 [Lutzomyia longipalpis]|uniref:Putative cyclin b n=1 Tax=Lutzomyia longipalpis TaxID=7200 RepID=A0A1B0CAS6_LUTLO|nr:G2/mitotic-specific cyclin-B3 [Lutzomyia longipalpis]
MASKQGVRVTRSKTGSSIVDHNVIQTRNKRKADPSPLKNDKVKRSALGNLTNATVEQATETKLVSMILPVKKAIKCAVHGKKKTAKPKENTTKIKTEASQFVPLPDKKLVENTDILENLPSLTRPMTRAAAARNAIVHEATAVKPKDPFEAAKAPIRRISNEFEKTGESVYMSALDETPSSTRWSISTNQSDTKSRSSVTSWDDDGGKLRPPTPAKVIRDPVPDTIDDFDKENILDPFQLSEYAPDIFEYLKEREKLFPIEPYMDRQPSLSTWMRALLVDWMVEVQESFELNHETLYLAVKLVDMYLSKVVVSKEKLQLLGATAMLISCKFDERVPPLIDDFLYVCDGAYNSRELIAIERDIFKTIGFDLGIPLSYRFLRRYARCAKIEMPVLTLARYILELSLMDYDTIVLSDSKMAAAALYIALKMTGTRDWDETLEYYSGYKARDFMRIAVILNNGLHKKFKEPLSTIRKKYSHKIFHEVSKKPLIKSIQLCGAHMTLKEFMDCT